MIWRLVLLYRRILWPWSISLSVIILAGLLGWAGGRRLADTPLPYTLWNGMFMALAGPADYSLISTFPWLVTHLYFLFHVNRSYSDTPHFLSEIIMLRTGSRTVWASGQLITLGILTAVYCVLFYLGVMAGIVMLDAIHPGATSMVLYEPFRAIVVLPLFCLFYGSLLVMSVLQFFLVLVTKHPIHGFIVSAVLYCAAWLVQGGLVATILPSTQSMIFRHVPFVEGQTYFTIEWSLLYNTIALTVIIFAVILYSHRMDITHD